MHNDYLQHHGVKGMKWGVRRYQNPDGTLTAAGQKHYSKISDDQLQKELYKQVKNKRVEQSGGSNRWRVGNTIGPHSKAAQDKYNADRKQYYNTPEVKKVINKADELVRLLDADKISVKEYDTKYRAISETLHPSKFNSGVTFNNGRKYADEYIKSYGSEINKGYLRDLGYDEATAEAFNKRVLKAKRKTLYGM